MYSSPQCRGLAPLTASITNPCKRRMRFSCSISSRSDFAKKFIEQFPPSKAQSTKSGCAFFLPAPYSEERRKTASEAAKKYGVHRKAAYLYGDRNWKVRALHGIIILDSYKWFEQSFCSPTKQKKPTWFLEVNSMKKKKLWIALLVAFVVLAASVVYLNRAVTLVPSRFMRKIVCRLRLSEVSRQ